MTATAEAQFTVSLRRRDVESLSKWRYVVTCERCGEDLSDDYSRSPAVIKVPDFDLMMVRNPARAMKIHQGIMNAWKHAAKTGMPAVIDAAFELQYPPSGPMLELAMEDHAEKCGR